MCLKLLGTLGQTRRMRRGRPRVLNVSWHFGIGLKLVLQTLGNLAICLQALDPKLNVPGTFGHFRSDQAHAQGEAQSSKSFLALWNRPKLVLQTLGKLAIRLQALDRKLKVPGTFGHFRSDQAHAQGEAESSKSFLALWNRPKLVLPTLGKLAIRLQA